MRNATFCDILHETKQKVVNKLSRVRSTDWKSALMRPGGVKYTLINICYSDMLTSAPCLHVGTKSEFQEEAGRRVHYPQEKSMSISYLKS